MTEKTDPPGAGTHSESGSPTSSSGLRAGTINSRHLVFFVIAAAAPLTILVGFAPLGLMVSGAALPVGYVVPGIVYLLFAVGFTAMSRHIRGAGAFYAYITEGLGKTVGAGASVLAYIGYLGGQIGFVVACGIFLSSTIELFLGVTVSVYTCALAVAVLVVVVGYRRVDIGAKVLAVLMALELGVLAVFCVAVLLKGGHEGLSLDSFSPSTFMTAGLASVFVLTFTSFVGFEQTAIYSEEVVDSKRTVSRATYTAVTVLAVVYAFCAWVIVQAVGPSRMGDLLGGDPSELIFDLNNEFAGSMMTDMMHLLIVTSFFAGCLALHNACSRYLLTMGRARVFPAALARVSPTTGTPSVAGITQGALVFAAIAGFALTPADPYTQVVVWTNTPTIIGVLVLQVLTSVAVLRFFSQDSRGEGLWQRLIAPSLAAVALIVALGYLLMNMSDLTGLTTAQNFLLAAPLLLAFAFGVVRGMRVREHSVEELSA
ncbi:MULTISPECIES: APC family permease [Rhodococcus]|uniref:APC family permease n=1 Tax=Rhodococcus TaxID=1827 RepID=UPI0006BA452E|nr:MULTISPECIES: APC family permease [Rhodococcus]KPH20653.1 amino acid permease [Rhodococcus sp. ADH]UUE24870.1 APC family permease [Rhodococcus qingshengii]